MKASNPKSLVNLPRIVWPVLLAFLISMNVFADGGASRAATKAEKGFYKTVYETFTKSLPPAPSGWNLTGDSSSNKDLKDTYVGAEKEPFKVEYMGTWQDNKRLQEFEQKFAAEVAKLTKIPPKDIEIKVREAEEKTAAHDATLRINLQANVFNEGIYQKITAAAPIGGGQVFRSESKFDSGWREGTTYVFLGKTWKLKKDGVTYMEATPDKNLPSTTVQTIMVQVQADPERAKQILAKIDWAALNRLIKN